MQVPRYWRMKKHLYQLNGLEVTEEVETQTERVITEKDKSLVSTVVTVEAKQKLPVVA